MDQKLPYEEIETCSANRKLDVDVDAALRMAIGAFLEGQSKVLAETAEFDNLKNLDIHKSGLELWRLLKYKLRSCVSVQ